MRQKRLAVILFGLGLIFFAIHNKAQPFLKWIFLPHLGFLMILAAIIYGVTSKSLRFTNKAIEIPLVIIVLFMWLRLIVEPSLVTLAGGLMGIVLFGCYLFSKKYGTKVLWAFPAATLLQAAWLIWQGIRSPGVPAGGYVTTAGTAIKAANYDIATGFLLMGFLFSMGKCRWWLSILVALGLFFTGAPEAAFAGLVMLIAIVARRDYSYKFIPVAVGACVTFVIVWVLLGNTIPLLNWSIGPPVEEIQNPAERVAVSGVMSTMGRIYIIKKALSDVKLLGHGYNINQFTTDTVHNVPLIIVDQLGIIPALAWLWVTLYCLIKTKFKYLWIGILSLCVFDHFIWTQIAPYWFVAIGVSTSVSIKNDYIYKES